MQFWYNSLFDLPKNIWKRTQTTKNTKKWSFFIALNTLSCQFRSWNKIKTIGHATTYGTLVIWYKCNISHSFICPKTWRKRSKRLKILKSEYFPCLNTPPCWPRSESKLKSIKHTTSYANLIISFTFDISQCFNWPKTWGKRPKWLKLLKNDHFS